MGFIPNIQNTGYYLPTTYTWDVSQILDIDLKDPEQLRKVLVLMYQNLNNMQKSVNAKDNGFYVLQEIVNGKQFFPDTQTINMQLRSNFRTTINFGALPNAGTKSVPHNINVDANVEWTWIYGTATDPIGLTGIPIAFVSAAGNNIQLDVDAVNVNITTTINYSNYTECIIVLEYMKF